MAGSESKHERGQGGIDSLYAIIDEVQKWYGWDDETILKLPLSRFKLLLRIISEKKARETKEKYIQSAFIGWQLSHSEVPFNEYIEQMGLCEDKIKHKKVTSKEAEKEADDILKEFGIRKGR